MRNGNKNIPDKEVIFNKSQKYIYLNNMDTDQLQALLQQESFLSNDDEFDAELIREITAILDRREPVFEDFNSDASLKQFREEIIPDIDAEIKAVNIVPKRKVPKVAIVFIAAVITLMFGGILTASALGYNIFDRFVSWGKEAFHIGFKDNDTTSESSDNASIIMGNTVSYKTLEDAMKALSIPEVKTNSIPYGYKLVNVEINEISLQKTLIAQYENGEHSFAYNITVFNNPDTDTYFEIDENSGEEITINGTDYYYMANIEQNRIVWMHEKTLYSINSELTKDELIEIVQSLNKGENKDE